MGMRAPLDGSGERILVIEDDPQEQALLIRLLAQAGYTCSAAADAAEARRLITRAAFDLLLADVKLPGESGLQFVQHVIAEHPATAAVMVTAVDDPALAGRAIEIGTYGYIMKPFSANEILIGVKKFRERYNLEPIPDSEALRVTPAPHSQ